MQQVFILRYARMEDDTEYTNLGGLNELLVEGWRVVNCYAPAVTEGGANNPVMRSVVVLERDAQLPAPAARQLET